MVNARVDRLFALAMGACARLTGQKVRSNDWFAPRSGVGQAGGLTQAGDSRIRTAKRCERKTHQRAERIGRFTEISDLAPRFFASGEVT
jgi:hypothetical protein